MLLQTKIVLYKSTGRCNNCLDKNASGDQQILGQQCEIDAVH